jgi:hypothetical protein
MTVRFYNHDRPLMERQYLLEAAAWGVLSVAARNMEASLKVAPCQPGSTASRVLWERCKNEALDLVLKEAVGLQLDMWTRLVVDNLVSRTYHAWKKVQGTPCPLKRADGTCPRCNIRTGCLKRDL